MRTKEIRVKPVESTEQRKVEMTAQEVVVGNLRIHQLPVAHPGMIKEEDKMITLLGNPDPLEIIKSPCQVKSLILKG